MSNQMKEQLAQINLQKEQNMEPNHNDIQTPEADQTPEVNTNIQPPVINPDAEETKVDAAPVGELGSAEEQEGKEEPKEEGEEKEGVIKLISSIPGAVWDNGIKPTYEFFKNGASRIWGSMKDTYDAEIQLYKDTGPVRYGMGRLAKLGFKVIKLAILATVFVLLNDYVVGTTGVSLFSPTALAIVFAVGVILVLAKSYMDQKDAGATEISASEAGSHLVDTFVNA